MSNHKSSLFKILSPLVIKPKIYASAMLTMFALSACNGDSSNANTTSGGAQVNKNLSTSIGSASTGNSKNDTLKSDPYLLRMGGGYDKVTQTASSGQSCLVNASNPNNIYIANPKAIITFDEQTNMAMLENSLNVNVSGSYGGDRFGLTAEASFANSSKNDSYTTNILYQYKYSGKAVFRDGSLGQGFEALTPYAASLEQTNPTKFRTMCGNSFVEQMDAGAVLGVRLSLSFNSHIDQEHFNASMEGHYGLANIAAKIAQASSNSNVNVALNLSAIQEGGEPQRLNDLFGKRDQDGHYPILKCQVGAEGVEACAKMIDNVIAYAQTMKDQLSNASGGIALEKLYYSNPIPTDYVNLGIPTQGAADPSPEILAAMRQLTTQYDKTMANLQFTSHYLTVLPGNKLDNTTSEELQDSAKKLYNQVYNVFKLSAYNLMDCYKGYVSTQCLTIRDNVETALEEYSLTDQELSLINYLWSNAYSVNLINYYGGAIPAETDYHLSASKCFLIPVSSPVTGKYTVNCDGNWLETSNSGITILKGMGDSGRNVKNLSYVSGTYKDGKPVNGQRITYKDEFLSVDDYYKTYFYHDNVDVSAPNYFTSSERLGLTLLHENQI